jgi:hypothetical protein
VYAVTTDPLVEDIKISHLDLLVELKRPDHKLRKSVLLARLLAARRPAARLAAPTTLRGPGCAVFSEDL